MNAKARILVVDDDAGGRRLTRATLARAGFEVTEAQDGQAALDAMRAALPDLVLLDVSMPVMDGFTACAELRKLPGGSSVPVVMMTGLDDLKSIARAFEAGATDFITKPINWTILAHRVRYMLRASSAINDLEQNQRRLSNAQRIGEMGDWEWDVRQDRILPSEQAWRIFGHEAAHGPLPSAGFLATVHPDDAQRVRNACQGALADGEAFSIEHRIVQACGALRHVHQQVEVLEQDPTGAALYLAGAVHDITRRKDAEEQIRRLAYFDPLTGLPNRLLFTEQLHKGIAHAERHGRQLAVLFIDLDHFKRVNDTLGHSAGDELLRIVSARLATSIRALDAISRGVEDADENSIARLGGDEFIVMLNGLHTVSDASSVARRLAAALSEPVTVQCTELFVSASIGVAMYPYDGADIDTLLMNADTAMYRAKEAGRGGVQFYDRSMNARALERLVMETMLRRALDRSEFVLHYQPRFELASGRIVGAEALIRWHHPERGLVQPSEFVPMAEENNLIIPIGEWVIAEACRQSAAWRAAGLNPGVIAVNLAATHLREPTLPVLVAQALQEHGLPATSLEIEVTESVLMTDPELSVASARRLSDIGVGLAIDDFGTGYSSLSYLKRLPITALKIDRSFIHDLAVDADDAAIITAIIAMAHTLKMKVIAEGVETEAQLAFLRANGCDEMQGFLCSHPLEAQAFAYLLEQRRPWATPFETSTRVPGDAIAIRGRVLLAEHNRVNQFVARNMLESLGCEFEIVPNGLEALLAMQRGSFDLVLMGGQMPVMDGIAATREIRAWELAQGRSRRTPIVALSSNGSAADAHSYRAAGMDDHLVKPYSRKQLGAVITRWLSADLLPTADEAALIQPAPMERPTPLQGGAALDAQVLANIRELDEAGQASVLDELIGIYLGEAGQHLSRLCAALENKDAAEIDRVAHAFRSASLNLGAMRLGEICRQLQRQGRAGELDGAVELVRAIERQFEMIRPVLLAEMSETA
ncbi:MAG: EAL domain-containing protein [Burkholderiaceae bacterium]